MYIHMHAPVSHPAAELTISSRGVQLEPCACCFKSEWASSPDKKSGQVERLFDDEGLSLSHSYAPRIHALLHSYPCYVFVCVRCW